METIIQEILNELYGIDPSLKVHEEKIIKIIEEYRQAKPDTKFDAEFASRLKKEILARLEEFEPAKTVKVPFGLSFANKFTYALVGAAVMILIMVIPLTSYLRPMIGTNKLSLSFESGISKMAKEAFGNLIPINNQGASTLTAPTAAVGESANLKTSSDASKSNAAIRSSAPLGFGGGGGAVGMTDSAKIMPPYEITNFVYKYVGQDLQQDETELPVYKRVKNGAVGAQLGQVLAGTKTDLLDLSKFNGAAASNINLTEDREYGYMISLNFTDDMVSIFQNWVKWPRPESQCQDEACFQQYRLKYENVPPDDNIITIADDFLKAYGIDKTGYGEPYVMDYWRQQYLAAEDRSQVYIPEEMAVIYPLVIDNKTVHDESGNATGLSVGVNLLANKVSSVNVITPQNYDQSDYQAVTDAQKILDMANRGGMYNYYYLAEGGKEVTVELDTPKLALLRYYSYNNETQTSDELYVPCYIFPVKSVSDTNVYFDRKNVVVPLAEEIFNQFGDNGGMPVPLMKSDSGVNSVTPDTVTSPGAISEPGQGVSGNTGSGQTGAEPAVPEKTVK